MCVVSLTFTMRIVLTFVVRGLVCGCPSSVVTRRRRLHLLKTIEVLKFTSVFAFFVHTTRHCARTIMQHVIH